MSRINFPELVINQTQANSGGPRTGFFCQELFAVIYQNYPKFAHPFRGLPKFAQIIPSPQRLVNLNYLHYSRKKYLTSSAYYCIIGAPAPKDHSNCKKFCPHPQKRLDNSSTTTYNGAGYLWENRHRTTTGAPAPKFFVKGLNALFFRHKKTRRSGFKLA